jgi:isocitrate dehydrogenase
MNISCDQVTCFTKDNIMKLTDGVFSSAFRRIAAEFPDIVSDHMLVDIGAARVAARPEQFDVIVTTNLYGDIVSDIAAEVVSLTRRNVRPVLTPRTAFSVFVF